MCSVRWKGDVGKQLVYHGGGARIDFPRIIAGRNKDFGQGFYCTMIKEQAERWALRRGTPTVNVYDTPSYILDCALAGALVD